MNCFCAICEHPMIQSQKCMVYVEALYQDIPSNVSFAVSQPTWADPATLVHHACYVLEQQYMSEEGPHEQEDS